MKIRVADSTGCPVPQFVVTAEDELDRIILRAFLAFPDYAKAKWDFVLHGFGGSRSTGGNGYDHFNLGWRERKESKQQCESVNPDEVSPNVEKCATMLLSHLKIEDSELTFDVIPTKEQMVHTSVLQFFTQTIRAHKTAREESLEGIIRSIKTRSETLLHQHEHSGLVGAEFEHDGVIEFKNILNIIQADKEISKS